eukprot:TRINITY_DN27660_c0_g1_i1.p1 TRINITY_DN27660_c0_g1~~TRINITY_DN27660_c0_g1_i1.p1  ORF type:complete len:505 (+),score=61.02 TRINITY_DN27660_c0_g1_i1:91-1605(+)
MGASVLLQFLGVWPLSALEESGPIGGVASASCLDADGIPNQECLPGQTGSGVLLGRGPYCWRPSHGLTHEECCVGQYANPLSSCFDSFFTPELCCPMGTDGRHVASTEFRSRVRCLEAVKGRLHQCAAAVCDGDGSLVCSELYESPFCADTCGRSLPGSITPFTISRSTSLGRVLFCLAGLPSVRSVLDLFLSKGDGTTTLSALGLLDGAVVSGPPADPSAGTAARRDAAAAFAAGAAKKLLVGFDIDLKFHRDAVRRLASLGAAGLRISALRLPDAPLNESLTRNIKEVLRRGVWRDGDARARALAKSLAVGTRADLAGQPLPAEEQAEAPVFSPAGNRVEAFLLHGEAAHLPTPDGSSADAGGGSVPSGRGVSVRRRRDAMAETPALEQEAARQSALRAICDTVAIDMAIVDPTWFHAYREWSIIEESCRPLRYVVLNNINLPGHAGWIREHLMTKPDWAEVLTGEDRSVPTPKEKFPVRRWSILARVSVACEGSVVVDHAP